MNVVLRASNNRKSNIDLIRILLIEDKYIKLTDRIIYSFKNKHYMMKEENENNQ